MADQNRGRTSLPVPAPPRVAAAAPAAVEYGNHAPNEQRQTNRARPRSRAVLMLRNWRVRWRVLALVIVPTVAAIVLGGVRVEAARSTAASFARISQVANLGRDFTALTQSVEDERDLSAGFLASSAAGDKAQATALLSKLQAQYGVTDKDLAAAQGLADQVSSPGSGDPQATRTDVTSAMENLQVALPDLRGFVHSQLDPLSMTNTYTQLLAPLLAFDNDIAAGSSNPQLALFASLLGSAAQMEDQASQQRALLYAALFQDQFQPGLLSALNAAQTEQASTLAAFQASAATAPAFIPASGGTPAGFSSTLTQLQQFSNTVQGPLNDDAQRIELDAVIAGEAGRNPDGGVGNATEWFTDMTSTLSQMRSFDATELEAISSQANTLQQGALGSEKLTALIVLILLLFVIAITIVVARSMIIPLRRLRTDALDVANRRLPDMVRQLSQSGEETAQSVQIAPISIDSTDEIGEVARAFDQVHGEAVRLAAEEAMLRANLNAMFVNLSRRSQSLIERQLGIIESLEQGEQDSDRLSSLFRLDHLATRMRRNSENLLVLAGHEAPRKWTKPVPLVDVVRAAVSEIEQYERITLNVQSGLVIAGRAASDVVHLVAELAENATTFSREDTQVKITGQQLSSGGVLIEITDEGLGIPEQELAHANWRLDNPPVIDVAVSRRMGLFVVGRLAARHGIRVRLRRAAGGSGLSALIWVPDTVAESEPLQVVPNGGRRRGGTIGIPVTASAVTVPPTNGMSATMLADAPAPVPAPVSSWFGGRRGEASSSNVPPAAPQVRPQVAPTGTWGADPEPATIPPVEAAPSQRLPIYDSVESDWFRRGAPFSVAPNGGAAGTSWKSSPADEGFRRAAETVVAPATAQTTNAGLPKRVAGANLVPGSVTPRNKSEESGAQPTLPPELPIRSAEEVRARMSSFQLRGRAGRSEGQQGAPPDEN